MLALVVGSVAMSALGASPPRCLGPASLDPLHPCENPALARMAMPSLSEVIAHRHAPCEVRRRARPQVCTFGVARHRARRRVALIGDSHSVHWRAALTVVARRRSWHVYSLYQTHCPFNRVIGNLAGDPACQRWNDDAVAWMKGHPGIDTVIVSEHEYHDSSTLDQAIRGYIAAWNALPRSVTRIIVIRDTPYIADDSQACVERSLSQHGHPGYDCREPRASAVHTDAAELAARQLNSPRVQIVDMARYFCDSLYCYPVVGGVRTHWNRGHLSLLFSTLLGPYLDRELFPLVGARR